MSVLAPEIRIIDSHHHLYPEGHAHAYPEESYRTDLTSGHRVEATVFVDCVTCYRQSGDPAFAPVGETEYIAGVLRSSRSKGGPVIGAGIVSFVDFTLDAPTVTNVLAAHIAAGEGAFRGVRHPSTWHENDAILPGRRRFPRYLLSDTTFRRAFAELEPAGLSFDAWLFYNQLPELSDLAAHFEGTKIVVDHFGGPIAPSTTAEERKAVFAIWSANIAELARRPNVYMKLGGFGMPLFGFGCETSRLSAPASAEHLAEIWRPYVETCVNAFGATRCMFETNFPVDRATADYPTLWNTFKLLAQNYSRPEQEALFFQTANSFYRLSL